MKSLMVIVLMIMFQAVAQEVNLPQVKLLEAEVVELDSFKLGLVDFHKHHVKEFVKAEGFGESRVIIMPKIIELKVAGELYRMRDMKLLSVTDRKNGVVWEFPGKLNEQLLIMRTLDRKKIENGHMKKRALSKIELGDMQKLKKGEKWVLHKDQRNLRVMAPLHGGPTCIRCHEDYKKGEFMGAFIYDLTAVDKVLYISKEGEALKKEDKTLLSQDK